MSTLTKNPVFSGIFPALLLALAIRPTASFATVTCSTGYSLDSGISAATFIAPKEGTVVCPLPGYHIMEYDDEYEFTFDGIVVGNEITTCNNGYYTGGQCVSYTTGDCETGNYDIKSAQSTFKAVEADGSSCLTGFTARARPDEWSPIYNGFVLGSEITLCPSGYYTNGACSTYASGDCLSGYYDNALDSGTFAGLTGGTCSSPYTTYSGSSYCDHNPVGTCIDVPHPTVSVVWTDDGDTLDQTTCYVGEGIVLPESTPTRAGYTFGGWRVATQN